MRMWMLDPKYLCKKHLMGEHFEIHLHRHNFVKHHSVSGRVFPIVLIEPASMQSRHDALVVEMLARGYNHNSPYEQPDISYLPPEEQMAKGNIEYNRFDLISRCEECRKRIENEKI